VDRRGLVSRPGIEGAKDVLFPALEVAEQLFYGPIAATEAVPG
jgi:hypothetical protein